MKKIALSLLMASSSFAFAGTMGPVCTPDNVTVPCASTAWDVGVQALYLKPSFSGNWYAYNFLGYTPGSFSNFIEKNNDWKWGFRVEGSYHFGTGSDVNVNWSHYNRNTTTLGNTYASLISGTVLAFDYDQQKIRWDAVNAEFAQHADFGLFKNIRFHAGLQYAYLKLEDIAPVTIDGTSSINHTLQKYNGLGPRVGLDLSYDFTDYFAVYGKFAGALLAGNGSTDDTSSLPFLFASAFKVVPELESKLGATYTHPFGQGTLIVDGGYMINNYFNVVELPANVISAIDIAFQGPYIGLKWIGTV